MEKTIWELEDFKQDILWDKYILIYDKERNKSEKITITDLYNLLYDYGSNKS